MLLHSRIISSMAVCYLQALKQFADYMLTTEKLCRISADIITKNLKNG